MMRSRQLLALAVASMPVVSLHAQQTLIRPLDTSSPTTYHISIGEAGSASLEGDRQLAEWALQAWSNSTGGALEFVPTAEADALVRVYFVPAGFGQYGEMRPLSLNGRRGAAVYIRPDTSALGPEIAQLSGQDPLLRDVIVYLTCLHELGHAVGLVHTSDYADIMYAFGYGGDIVEYFLRYRRQIETRGDIADVSGIAAGDLAQLATLYP